LAIGYSAIGRRLPVGTRKNEHMTSRRLPIADGR
jgi:hypothetical protein